MSEPEPTVPADQGLTGLGLLMQLAGSVFAAATALLVLTILFDDRMDADVDTACVFGLLGFSIVRSIIHRTAGAQLVYGDPNMPTQRLGRLRRYIGVGLIHSLVFGAVLLRLHMPGRFALGVTTGLALWPITLLVITLMPRFRRFHTELPISEDKGFEGASIFMTVLGTCGLVGTATLMLVMVNVPGRELERGSGVLILLALGMLLVRSVIHVQAGLSGLRVTSVDRSVELANRYANFGVISSFCGGGAMTLYAMSSSPSIFGLTLVTGVCWLLMAWPLIVRRFFADRQFADLLAGDTAPAHHRAPDAGLTWLGWFLIANAVYAASFLVPHAALVGPHSRDDEVFMSLGGALGLRSLWWNVGLVVLQAWAGFELVRMSRHSRVIATVFGVVATAVSLYIDWPMIEEFRNMRGLGGFEMILIAPLAMSLIVPVATILLVHRRVTPTARARFRSRPDPSTV